MNLIKIVKLEIRAHSVENRLARWERFSIWKVFHFENEEEIFLCKFSSLKSISDEDHSQFG